MAMSSMLMEDVQLQAAICSGGRWWSDARIGRPGVVHDPPAIMMSAPFSCSSDDHLSSGSSSSTADGQYFNRPAACPSLVDATAGEPIRACDGLPGSYSTTTYQDIEYPGEAYSSMAMEQILESCSMQVFDRGLFSPNCNWSQPFLQTTADETRVHGEIQEWQEHMYSSPYCPHEPGTDSDQIHEIRSIYNQLDLLEGIHAMSTNANLCSVLFPAPSPPLATPSSASAGPRREQVDESCKLTTAGQPKQRVQFIDEAPVWNPCVSSAAEACSRLMHQSSPTQLVQNEINVKENSGAKKSSLPSLEENLGSAPALKKARIETPSPLTTFKVRKEKLGDRITLLQHLVSPFGKTDTASVLHEAIDYIKFLHDQVQVLSSPHSKINGQKQEDIKVPSQDLRSRGLYLVPISSTVEMVARENPVDLWPLEFGADHSC